MAKLKFDIEVSTLVLMTQDVEVEAETLEEAYELAKEEAKGTPLDEWFIETEVDEIKDEDLYTIPVDDDSEGSGEETEFDPKTDKMPPPDTAMRIKAPIGAGQHA